jgi:hypothetical protein
MGPFAPVAEEVTAFDRPGARRRRLRCQHPRHRARRAHQARPAHRGTARHRLSLAAALARRGRRVLPRARRIGVREDGRDARSSEHRADAKRCTAKSVRTPRLRPGEQKAAMRAEPRLPAVPSADAWVALDHNRPTTSGRGSTDQLVHPGGFRCAGHITPAAFISKIIPNGPWCLRTVPISLRRGPKAHGIDLRPAPSSTTRI